MVMTAVALHGQIAVGKRTDPTSKPTSKYFDAKQLLKDVEYLASDELEGRSADRPSMAKAREYVEKRFKESGLSPIGSSFKQEFSITRRNAESLKGINYVGQIKGKKSPEKYIVITAHYDHVGIQNGEIYNGADDNASGTAALFAIAKHFSKKNPDHSLIFVAFDAEEKGLQGARHFVANLPVAKEKIIVNVNMDMLSRNDNSELYVAGLLYYPSFTNVFENVRAKTRIKLLRGHDMPGSGSDDWTFQSDHGAFHREKIPFLYFGVEDHADYHRPTDEYSKIQPKFYVKAVETVLAVISEIDKETWGSGIGSGYSPIK